MSDHSKFYANKNKNMNDDFSTHNRYYKWNSVQFAKWYTFTILS